MDDTWGQWGQQESLWITGWQPSADKVTLKRLLTKISMRHFCLFSLSEIEDFPHTKGLFLSKLVRRFVLVSTSVLPGLSIRCVLGWALKRPLYNVQFPLKKGITGYWFPQTRPTDLHVLVTDTLGLMCMTHTRKPVSILSTPLQYLCKVSGYYREMWHTAVRVDPEHLKYARCHARTGRGGARRRALRRFPTICAKFFGFVNQLLCQLSLAIIQVKKL